MVGMFAARVSNSYMPNCRELLCHIHKMEHDAEGVLVADIDLGLIPVAKYFMDPAGHYSTPGNMQLFVDASRQKPVFILGEEEPEGLSYEDIQFEVQ